MAPRPRTRPAPRALWRWRRRVSPRRSSAYARGGGGILRVRRYARTGVRRASAAASSTPRLFGSRGYLLRRTSSVKRLQPPRLQGSASKASLRRSDVWLCDLGPLVRLLPDAAVGALHRVDVPPRGRSEETA